MSTIADSHFSVDSVAVRPSQRDQKETKRLKQRADHERVARFFSRWLGWVSAMIITTSAFFLPAQGAEDSDVCPNVTTGTIYGSLRGMYSDCQISESGTNKWVAMAFNSVNITTATVQTSLSSKLSPEPIGGHLVGNGTGTMYIVDAGTTEPDCRTVSYEGADTDATAQDLHWYCGFFQIDTGDDHGIYLKGYWDGENVSWSHISAVSFPKNYSIGGTLSGLDSGQSLVLQNNDADDLEVTANGDFTFATEIPAEGSYSVSVLTQPTDQTCAVSNGSGDNVTADVNTVAVSCGTPPVLNYFTRYQPSSPTNANSVSFVASISSGTEVKNVDKTDFVVDGNTTATVTDVTFMYSMGDTHNWLLTVSGGDLASFNGTVGINLSATQDITNSAGFPLRNIEPETDQTFTIENPQYRSKGSGNWSNTATWQQSTDDGANWQDAAAAPASDNGGITIENGHTVTVDSDLTAKGITVATGGILEIAEGATLTLGDDQGEQAALDVAGGLVNSGTITPGESSTVAFTGASDSTFTLNALTTLPKLVVNKTEPTNKLQLLGGFRLKVRNVLEVIRGTLDLSGWSQNLSFGGQLKIRSNGRWTRHASTENAVECDGTCTISDETADADGPQRLGRLWLRRFAND